MLISKFNLYKSEWLELVFNNRNKDYGAYYLRQHYAGNMVRAMGITFLGIGLLCGGSIILRSNEPVTQRPEIDKRTIVTIQPPPVQPIKKTEPAITKPLRTPATPIRMTQNNPPVVVADPIAAKPIINDQIQGAIGPITTSGPANGNNALPGETSPGTGTPPDESVHILRGLDVLPEPVGGPNAWAKFLNKNLRFPYEAQSDGVSGKVYLSFIIEKDGHLSNITIDQAAGHGFDEEAMRVLKMAKAWKPGMQNGQPVRVKYQIPINFQSAPAD